MVPYRIAIKSGEAVTVVFCGAIKAVELRYDRSGAITVVTAIIVVFCGAITAVRYGVPYTVAHDSGLL